MPRDLRRALRSLSRRRAFAATVVLTLALAFSIPAVVLSTVDRHFWRPLDLVEPERLFTLQIQADDGSFSPLSHPEYVQLRDSGEEAYSLATVGGFDFTLTTGGVPARVNVALVSGNFFAVLEDRAGARPPAGAAGRRSDWRGGRCRFSPRLDGALRSGSRHRRTHRAAGFATVHGRSASP